MADAWKDMNDIQRASALELMGGKRQANVLSALIQNFDTVEKVIEASADSAGSALQENEKYLDSIQGKIDQFSNSLQSMWSNTLDSGVVKWFVDVGTQLIKIVDTLGLIPSILISIASFKVLKSLFSGVDIIKFIKSISALTMGTKVFEAETRKAAFSLMAETLQVKLANSSLVQYAIKMKLATAADVGKMTATQLLGLSFKALGVAIWGATKAIIAFLFTNPVGWLILLIGAIAGGIAAFNAINETTEELQEKLDEMKSNLADVRSELNSVNQELETTNERMAELLAKDTLSFVEQEELKQLQKTNDELEHRKELLEAQEKYEAGRVGRQAAKVVDSKRDETGWWLNGKSEDKEVLDDIDDYIEIKHKLDNAATLEEQKEWQEELDEKSAEIDEYIGIISEALKDVEYGDSKESDKALDYLAELQGNYNIARGSANAKSNEIKRIFGKDVFSDESEEIDNLVEKLKKDPGNKTIISQISEQCKVAEKDLKAVGLSVEDAKNYFTMLGQEASFGTLKGKIKEVSSAAKSFESLLNGDTFKIDGIDIGLANLFDEEGKIIQTKLSQVFQGTSEQTREDISHLLEGSYDQIKNGTVDVERLLSGFALKTTQQVLEIQNTVLGEQNLELFPNLKDEIDGIIDKFNEFSSAVGSVVDAMDALEQARAEEAYSGSISIETLENLMKYTDDYAQLVEIDETGAIRLSTDAEKILIEQRIQKIKTDAAAAVQTAQSNLEQAKYNAKAINETGPVQEALTSATDGLAGSWAYLGSIIGDITDGNFSGIFERASTAYGEVTAGREEKRAQVNVSVEDAEEALANALNQQKIADALTSDNIKSKHSSEEASGGNKTKEDAEKDLIADGWDKLISEYENKLALITNERDLIQAEIDRMEAQGGKASAQYYEDLIRGSKEEKTLLEEKLAAQQAYLEANKGNIDQDTWTEYNNEINETAVAIKECEVNTIEWAEALREIDTHYFEQITSEVSRLGEELEFVNSLLEDEEVADENGNWSSAALTRMGLYTQQMEKAAAEASMYQDEIDKLNGQYEDGVLSEEQYQEALSNLVSGQQDAIMSYESAKDSIVEMNEARIDAIRTGIEAEIEAYEDLISAKQDELSAERDLYEFRKDTEQQTKNISELERKIASLSGSSAASDVASRRKLEAELMEAKSNLNDSFYSHSRDAQSAALDEESEAFALSKEKYIEQLEEQLKDTETLIENSIMDVMLNADTVYTELNELADLYGVDLSESLTQPWQEASAQAIKWKDELKTSMTAGEYAALIGEGGAITAFANGVATKLQGSWSKAQTAAQNYAGYLTGTELNNKLSNTLTGFGNQIQAIIDKWNGVKKAADDAYTAQTRKVTVGGTGSGATDSGSGGTSSGGGGTSSVAAKKYYTTATLSIGGKTLTAIKSDVSAAKALSAAKIAIAGEYEKLKGNSISAESAWQRTWRNKVKYQTKYYAKGTMGTKRDEWAITDEPQFGDELVLIPGESGNLSFVRKGTGIIPADLTQKLVELAQIPISDLMYKNMTAIVPNITKNDIRNDIHFDSLVHVDHCDQSTLKDLEKMVDTKIDQFGKQMNYSLKKFAR